MRKIAIFIFAVLFIVVGCSKKRSSSPKILVFTKTAGFVHQSIPEGVKAIQKLGKEHNFEVVESGNASEFTDEILKEYSAIVFLSTTGDVLNTNQSVAFERYIQAGGGFVGVHAAADTEYDWNWYGKLVGAYFLSHPHQQEATFVIEDSNFIATNFFEDKNWVRRDELYNYKKINPNINVLINIDESTYEGGENGEDHPMAWYHEYDGGRAFYTGLGHTDESFEEELFLKHLLGGIQYAIGENLNLNYSKVRSQFPPSAERFSKKNLSLGEFFEPTEMTILPNLDVLIAQRRGEIMHYSHSTKEVKQVALLDVYHKTSVPGVNAEEGLMGLQRDPNFEKNNWVYAFYSPTGDEWVNRLSRFTFKNGEFDLSSEVKILDVESQREICCHTGGSIAFGGDGLLYLSTGDNTTPFDEPEAKYVNSGFAPLNDLPGKEQFDARRSSGNSNDLRGKILRIRVNEDGSYSIPEGNLFPEGIEKTRPEIYTMGHRNPYRISVDPKKGYLYWGEVGPDANADSLKTRGPRGYDEVGQAKEAGNYGWPYFIADNKSYYDYDYETGKSGAQFDVNAPINDSRNNTGIRELPPGKEAMIWYPYAKSTEFPQVGTGGRNAMAGPVYYNDMFPKEKALPQYYNGKVIIYEWMRGWMKAVSLFDNGDFNTMEPFAENIDLNNLIDMEVGPNGQIYLLEYGSGWFQKNDDSGLSVIEYNGGNLPPEVEALEADKSSGLLPLKVDFKVTASDVESENLTYSWDFGNGDIQDTSIPTISYVYNSGGEFKAQVTVLDSDKSMVKSNIISIVAGNEEPLVSIEITNGNSSFFIPGKALNYKVSVKDSENSGPIDENNIYVSVDYLSGMDQVNLNQGHKQVAATVTGKALTQSLDCKACHKENGVSIGPSYAKVSEKYKNDKNAATYLANKIKAGGGGVWGETNMAAHPDLSDEDLRQITAYILSLKRNDTKKKSLPSKGVIIPKQSKLGESLVISASYTDKGEGTVKPLTGSTRTVLPSNMVDFSGDIETEGFMKFNFEGTPLLILPGDKGWFKINNLDLSDVKTASILMRWQGEFPMGASFEAHLDTPDGELLGKGSMKKPVSGQEMASIQLKLMTSKSISNRKVYFTYTSEDPTKTAMAGLIMIQFN
ncbi:ThuA domain-containing protein [Urechidicola vernalis]|uniref:ThuA domain-containing protein n=1 Tax=Urechidicola vernalis TaxID=3075600 RepID=A0ABU2Y3R3_9FLAO|nr:ThuA domain-containing protein [Urechidicola sp. P050]MDT0551668.1 ThuA domain-containing protein [Urechidicola sp. P050]